MWWMHLSKYLHFLLLKMILSLSITIVLQGPLLKHGVVILKRSLKEEVTYLHRVNIGNDHVAYADFYKNSMAYLMSSLSMIIICESLVFL